MARKHPESADGRPAEVSRPDPVAAKAAAIKAMQAHPPTWKTVIKRVLVLAAAGLAIYLVLPGLMAVLGSWPRLSTLSPIWFTAAVAAELAAFTCNFAVQRLALRTRGWFAVVTAGLAGNAVTDSLPGGGVSVEPRGGEHAELNGGARRVAAGQGVGDRVAGQPSGHHGKPAPGPQR